MYIIFKQNYLHLVYAYLVSDNIVLVYDRYQFNPSMYQTGVTAMILLKALTNLPHSDFILCKCLIETSRVGISHQSGV